MDTDCRDGVPVEHTGRSTRVRAHGPEHTGHGTRHTSVDSPRVGVLGLLETLPTLSRGTDIRPPAEDTWNKGRIEKVVGGEDGGRGEDLMVPSSARSSGGSWAP